MKNAQQYSQYKRPSWAPPSWLFAPVWTVLYIIIIVSFGYVVDLFITNRIAFVILLPFILNVIFNVLYTPIQFGLKNMKLATIDILLVLGTLLWATIVIHGYAGWVTYANIPYLLWVLFATTLQITILRMN